jgi:hypothetical protein
MCSVAFSPSEFSITFRETEYSVSGFLTHSISSAGVSLSKACVFVSVNSLDGEYSLESKLFTELELRLDGATLDRDTPRKNSNKFFHHNIN